MALAALTVALVAVVGRAVAVGDPNVGSTPELPTTDRQTTTRNTGLQQTATYGYIPQRETTTFQSGLIGPGGGRFLNNGPFQNAAPPLPNGAAQPPVDLPSYPTLATPSG